MKSSLHRQAHSVFIYYVDDEGRHVTQSKNGIRYYDEIPPEVRDGEPAIALLPKDDGLALLRQKIINPTLPKVTTDAMRSVLGYL